MITLLWHSLLALLQVSVPGVAERRIQDMFAPLASPGQNEKNIAMLTLAITLGIFIVVGGLIVYTIWRFRGRPDNDTHQEPPQVYGSNQLEVAWTVIPVLIVFVLIGVSARVIASVQNASPPPSMTQVRLIGHQWWWEIEYPQFNIHTANEIHVPQSTGGNNATYLQLESIDVIHSFWVPALAGKTDLIPNRVNYMWIDPQAPGVYMGNCAEYCGTQHANMLLRVVVQPVQEFNAWAAHEAQAADSSPQDAKVKAAKDTFESLACVNCHNIRGTAANGRFGPDLTHVAERQTLGAGVLVNNAKNLRDWVNDPQDAKPGCLMPSMKLTNSELDQIVTYLESLH